MYRLKFSVLVCDTVSSTFKTNFTSSQDTAVSETLNTLRSTTEFILCLTGRRMMPRPRRDRKVWVSRRRRDRDVGVSRPRRDWDIGLTVSRRDREDQKTHRDRLETETFDTETTTLNEQKKIENNLCYTLYYSFYSVQLSRQQESCAIAKMTARCALYK